MTISTSLRSSLTEVFKFDNRGGDNSGIESIGVSVAAKTIDRRFIVPAICVDRAALYFTISQGGDIVAPLDIPSHDTKKTSDAIISSLFKRNRYRYRNLVCIDTTKGYKYHGGKGLILTEDFKPLMLCGYQVDIDTQRYRYECPVCLVSPKVFTRDDMVSKCIVKKIIPFYSTNEVYCGYDVNDTRCGTNPVKVIITTDIEKFIRVPHSPMGIDVDDEIYSLLCEHLTELQ